MTKQMESSGAMEVHPEMDKLPEGTLELYKLAVEMADRISVRRGAANSFFLTLNTAMVGIVGALNLQWYLPAAGLIISLSWWMLLRNYRNLNRAKFRVILAIERDLPVHIFGDEWALLEPRIAEKKRAGHAPGSWLAQFRELGAIERIVPIAFAVFYLIEIARKVLS
jgi:hypothetical protein